MLPEAMETSKSSRAHAPAFSVIDCERSDEAAEALMSPTVADQPVPRVQELPMVANVPLATASAGAVAGAPS